MKNRRGVALLTALWLVVAIAVVVLEFSLEATQKGMVGESGAAWPLTYADLEKYYTEAERLLDVSGETGADTTTGAGTTTGADGTMGTGAGAVGADGLR